MILRAAILLACLVPLAAGLAGVLTGAGFLDAGLPGIGGVGNAGLPGVGGGSPAVDSHLRYLSGLLLGSGLALAWASFDLPRRGRVFAILAPIIVLGGLARLGGLFHATPPLPHLLALGMELGVTPLLWWCVRRAMRTHG